MPLPSVPETASAAEPTEPETADRSDRRDSWGREPDFLPTACFLAASLLILPFSEGVFNLPLKIVLMDRLHLGPQMLSLFMTVSGWGWGAKPLAGILTDRFPLFGSRRRSYLLLSIAVAAFGAALIGLVPQTFVALLLAHAVLNAGVVFAGVVTYSLLVEKGHERNATGRLSALQLGVNALCGLIVGPIAGYLASLPLIWAGVVAAGSLVLLLTVAFGTVREPWQPAARTTASLTSLPVVIREALLLEYRLLSRARTLWSTAGMLFLFFLAPGFGTLLLYQQRNTLHFSTQFIGNLTAITSAASIVGALLYPLVARRIRLGRLLALSIGVNALSALTYLAYRDTASACAIEAIHGFFAGSLTVLALYDLAVRVTPGGAEALGFAVILSVRNVASAISDWLGAALYQHLHFTFHTLVWINAGTTLLALTGLLLLPRALLRARDDRGTQDVQDDGKGYDANHTGLRDHAGTDVRSGRDDGNRKID